jgi:hypothetical protein
MICHFFIELENKKLPYKIYYYSYGTHSVNNSKVFSSSDEAA